MKNVNILEHPILQHKLGYIRDKNTHSHEFRTLMKEVSAFLAYEATRELKSTTTTVMTPMADTPVQRITNAPAVIAIMRAGNIMLEGILDMIPNASAGHIGIYRDKFIKNTVEYYFKIPENAKDKQVLLVDPLMATADTAIASVERLTQYGVTDISLLTVLCARSGIEKLHHFYPSVKIYTLAIESEMTADGFLLPGIGDASARLYNN